MKVSRRFRPSPTAVATMAVTALALAGCSSSGTRSGPATSTSAPAGVEAAFEQLTGLSTTLDLNAATMALFKQASVAVASALPATNTNNGATFTFPVTGGYVAVYPSTVPDHVRGAVSHSGGLVFSAPSKTLTVSDLVVNTGASVVTSTVGGKESMSLFDLDGGAVKVSKDGQGQTHVDGAVANLSQPASDALNRSLGVNTFRAGLAMGTLHQVLAGPAAPGGSPDTELIQLTGLRTGVDLNPDTAKALADNKITVRPAAPATASTTTGATTTLARGGATTTAEGGSSTTAAPAAVTTLVFPVGGGYAAIYPTGEVPYVRGLVSHSGGITFSGPGGKTLTVTDFMLNPGASQVFGTLAGKVPSVVKLFDLDGSQLNVSTDSQGQVHLDGTVALLSSQTALALNQTFAVTAFKEGMPLGVVHVVAAGVPAPK